MYVLNTIALVFGWAVIIIIVAEGVATVKYYIDKFRKKADES